MESAARRIAARLVRKQGGSPATGEGVWAEVDLASAVDRDRVSVGIEPAARAALERRDLPALLRQLGFNRRPLGCALGNSVGRMAKPGSERMTPRGPAAPARRGSASGAPCDDRGTSLRGSRHAV